MEKGSIKRRVFLLRLNPRQNGAYSSSFICISTYPFCLLGESNMKKSTKPCPSPVVILFIAIEFRGFQDEAGSKRVVQLLSSVHPTEPSQPKCRLCWIFHGDMWDVPTCWFQGKRWIFTVNDFDLTMLVPEPPCTQSIIDGYARLYQVSRGSLRDKKFGFKFNAICTVRWGNNL